MTVVAAGPQAAPLLHETAAAGVGDPSSPASGSRTAEPVASDTHVSINRGSGAPAGAMAAAGLREGLPEPALRAYRSAEATLRIADPSCRLGWEVLAGIGAVESDHGRRAGAALGPMQFLPSTWGRVGLDGDGDGRRDPHDIDDASLAAAAYLCAGAGDLSTARGLHAAVLRYNHSADYVALVTEVARFYDRRIAALPVASGTGVTVGVGQAVGGVLVGGSDDAPEPGGDGNRDSRAGGAPGGDTDGQMDARHGRRRSGDTEARPTHDPEHPSDEAGRARPQRGGGNDERGDDAPRQRDPKRAPAESSGPDKTDAPRPADTSKPRKRDKPAPRRRDEGDEAADKSREYTGTVNACGQGFCLDRYVLSGSGPYDGLVGETITVMAALEGQTLMVSHIVG